MLHPEEEREDVVILENYDFVMEAGLDLVDPVPGPSRAALGHGRVRPKKRRNTAARLSHVDEFRFRIYDEQIEGVG